MTVDSDEMSKGLSFNYAVFDRDEDTLLGCAYIDPPRSGQQDVAAVSWWVVDQEVGGDLDVSLTTEVPEWLARHWPFPTVRYCVESQFP